MKRSVVDLLITIEKCRVRIEKIRDRCPHTNKAVKHCGDTGNYDPTADCYWDENTCPDCGKRWDSNQKQASH